MRIISQNFVDVPYEKVVIEVNDNMIIFKPVNNINNKGFVLGVYKNSDRAKEVFKSIFDHYKGMMQMEDGCTLYMNDVFIMPEE